jgi:hypothetical protein
MTLDNQPSQKKSKKGLVIGLIAAGALAVSIGGVFAANSITINDGDAIEFGQGLAETATCDTTLTTTVNQEYDIAADKFYATTVVVGGVDDTACTGKTLHVSLVGTSAVVCSVAGTTTSGTNKDAFAITDDSDSSEEDLTVTIPASCDASTIKKVAITTS